MANNKTVCYQAIQVVYRDAVVSHFRNTLSKKLPEKVDDIVPEVLGEVRWAEAKAIVAKANVLSGMSIKASDSFDLIGVEHF